MTKKTNPESVESALTPHSTPAEGKKRESLSTALMGSAELRYEKIYQSIADAVFVIRVDDGPVFRYVDSNPYHEQLTGISTETLREKTPHELLPEPVASSVERNYRRCLNLKTVFVYEETLNLPRDRRTWATTLTPVMEAGEVRYIIGSSTDISELKTVAQAYQETSELFEHFFDLSPDLLCITDLQGRLLKSNAAWLPLLGYSPGEMKNSLFFDFVHPPNLEAAVLALNALNRSEAVQGFVLQMKTKNGDVRFLEWNAQATGARIYASARDITDRKATEDQLIYLNFHDALTGLYNRAYFEDALKRLDVPRNLPISVVTVDLNGLKLVNDTFGHQEGDALLKLAASVLKNACRADDIVARVGGDEFTILLPKTDEETVVMITQRIQALAHAARTEFVILSLSMGEATKTADHQVISRILKDSESAMYHNKLLESRWTKNALIESIAAVMENQAHRTMNHCRRVQKLCEAFGTHLGLTPERMRDLSLLALMHDIGIMSVPREIVDKPSPLDSSERQQIQKHSESGYRIAVSSPDFARVADDILSHHERWDGTGYPRGLSGRDIPLLSRIVSLVESYDTMVHDQIYKKKLSLEKVKKELADGAGTQFDPHLTKLFLSEFIEKVAK